MRSAFRRFAVTVVLSSFAFVSVQAAPEDEAIQKSIKKAVGYLKAVHQPGPAYRGGSYGTGTAPLVGLALLEAGVPETDPVLRNISHFVRENALSQTATYNLSLTILFLDKLGNPGDRPTIQLLGVRLVAGQGPGGGWNYECGNALTAAEEARLKKVFQNEQKLVNKPPLPRNDLPRGEAKVETPRADLPVDPKAPPNPDLKPQAKIEPKKINPPPAEPMPNQDDDKPKLHPEVAKWAKLVNQMDGKGRFAFGRGGDGDNSNTQFAILGVWTARKHGVPCEGAIAATERRFRASQNVDGGWNYSAAFNPPDSSRPAMTCAGLLALAVAHAAMEHALKNKPDAGGAAKPKAMADLGDDPAIKLAIKNLGAAITNAKGQPPQGVVRPEKRAKRFKPDLLNSNLYFLWSLERVAVLYGLETVGNHDWYVWGADALVDTQLANGTWATRDYPGSNPEVNTAFAVLFLSRANIARDLAAALKGKVKDPGVAVLRGGGEIAKILPRDPASPEPKANSDPPKPNPTVIGETTTPSPKVASPLPSNDGVALVKALVNVSDDERAVLLARYRDQKGIAYTEALAAAARKWTGDPQREAREALANRLTRMTVATLRSMLKDEDAEFRRAAARATGAKEAKECIPDLIEALRDTEEFVAQAALASLRSLTSQDFGPAPGATAGEKLKAVLAWRNWLKTAKLQ